MSLQTIKTALISVFHKEGLEPVIKQLHHHGVSLFSTGGTAEFIEDLGIPVIRVETITGFPSILDGRVKTLHPTVFGGILATDSEDHLLQIAKHGIQSIDLVIVDLYPFEDTLHDDADHDELIEKIDIGGISLIRAAAKNYARVSVISDRKQYGDLLEILKGKEPVTEDEKRREWAAKAFGKSSAYDALIGKYLSTKQLSDHEVLRYGENPHQKAVYHGSIKEFAEVLSGKELSYNNMVDTDAAFQLIREFRDQKPAIAIIKHTNACGLALGNTLSEAWNLALAGDPVSAFGGIFASNTSIDHATAELMDKLFFEVLLAPDFEESAFALLSRKKNRRIMKFLSWSYPETIRKSILYGEVEQDTDLVMPDPDQWKWVTGQKPKKKILEDLRLAVVAAKHLKSNTITLVKNKQLIGMGCGQTSRIDALHQAIDKVNRMGFSTQEAVMASDAFFPFDDCVLAAHDAGIEYIVQPGGSVNDKMSIDACERLGISMAFTGIRHFKH